MKRLFLWGEMLRYEDTTTLFDASYMHGMNRLNVK